MVDDRTVPLDWHAEALEQLSFHWEHHVRPRLDGLTDDELHWAPAPGGSVTTIAWRLWHVIEDVLGRRASAHFGDVVPERRDDAAGTLAALDAAYERWVGGVRAMGAEEMDRAVGAPEGPYADHPMATLVLHINREAIHHLAEVLVLRDLYRATGGRVLTDRPRRDPEPIGFQVTFDAVDPHAQARFWAAALHYEVEDNSALVRMLLDGGLLPADEAVEVDGVLAFRTVAAIRPPGAADAEADDNRRLLFNAVPEPRTAKNRVHLDLRVVGRDRSPAAAERLEVEVSRLEALGATVLHRHDEPDGRWVTLADPEGNELCVS